MENLAVNLLGMSPINQRSHKVFRTLRADHLRLALAHRKYPLWLEVKRGLPPEWWTAVFYKRFAHLDFMAFWANGKCCFFFLKYNFPLD